MLVTAAAAVVLGARVTGDMAHATSGPAADAIAGGSTLSSFEYLMSPAGSGGNNTSSSAAAFASSVAEELRVLQSIVERDHELLRRFCDKSVWDVYYCCVCQRNMERTSAGTGFFARALLPAFATFMAAGN